MRTQPRVIYVGNATVGDYLERVARPTWDFIKDNTAQGPKPIVNLNQFSRGLSSGTISTEAEIVMFLDLMFDPSGVNTMFEDAVATMSGSCMFLIISYKPEWRNLITQRVQQKQATNGLSGTFYFIDKNSPNPDIDKAIQSFIAEGTNREVAEIIVGRPIAATVEDTYEDTDYSRNVLLEEDDDPGRNGMVISVTSAKGGSGKSSVSTMLASYLSFASINSAREGLEKEPLKIVLIDFDLKESQLGFLTGLKEPTMLHLLSEGINEKSLDETILRYDPMKLDIVLAPQLPRLVDSMDVPFYKTLITMLKKRYDVVIIDTSVNYLDQAIEEVAYPMSDKIVYVCDYVLHPMFGMARWKKEVTREKGSGVSGGSGIDQSKIGVVFNNALSETNLSRELIKKALDGLPVFTAIPNSPKAVRAAANSQSMGSLVYNQDLRPSIKRLAEAIMGDKYKLSANLE